ncbi:hypothetical protein MMC20_005444 [Loxospora ochrophaea]|nr:hypothetical protein [Loxospora ochrophaea]
MSSQSSYPGVLVQEVINAAKALPSDVFHDDQARQQLQEAMLRLSSALDTPTDRIWQISFQNPITPQAQLLPVTCTAIEAGWFRALATKNSPKTAADLAKATGTDELLIARLMRVLTAAGIVDETAPQTYAATPITNALAVPKVYEGLRHLAHEALPLWTEFPTYLAKTSYAVPSNSTSSPFVHHFGMMQWDYFKAHPERGRSFNTFQEGQRQGRGAHWLDVYPAQERLGDDDGFATAHEADEPEAVLLVDVGGGRGHDLRDFRGWTRENGVLGRRLVLEDLPEVVADVDRAAISAEGIEAVGYDFFAPQPVKGAKAYFFHSIFHNWDDDRCRKILRSQAGAMRRGYSKLLINEIVVPEMRASSIMAGLDIAMMALFAGLERTQAQWSALLESEGFEILNVWQEHEGAEAVIEAVLKD